MRNKVMIVGAGEIGLATMILGRLMSKMENESEVIFVNSVKEEEMKKEIEPMVFKIQPTRIHQSNDYIELNRKSRDQVWKKKWKR